MSTSYKKLWKLLIDNEMTKSELRKSSGISPNTFTKMNKGENVALSVLDRICNQLNCDYCDIISHVPDSKIVGGKQ